MFVHNHDGMLCHMSMLISIHYSVNRNARSVVTNGSAQCSLF